MTDYVADFNLGDGDEFNAEFELEEEEYNALLELNVVGSLWGNITGDISNQTDLQQALNDKADINYVDSIQGALNDQINALDSIISSYGDIVTYDASDFADSAQGALADSALQPGNNISELINNAGYITASSLVGYATESWVEAKGYLLQSDLNGYATENFVTSQGYITGINSTDVISALGYTPYDATNPSGYISGITSGDVTTALRYTPYDGATNPNGYITSSALPVVNDGKLAIQVNSVDIGEFTANQATAATVNINVPTDTSDLTNGAGFLINNATGTNAFAVGNLSQSTAEGGVAVGYGARANSTYSTAVGQETRATNTNTTVIGRAAKATAARAIAIGSGAEANAQDAIAIKGINNTANTFQVYTYNMLDMSTGLIPDARISTNIARGSDMQTADNGLQAQIDAITASSDVTDIVGTYAELQAYDTTSLPPNSIIKVLQDESRNDETTYYRWVITGGVGSWVLIGEEGPYYTKAEANSTFVPQTRTVNNKALSADITLTASDVGALPDSTVIPTVNNSSVEFQINGAGFDTITLNQSSNDTINITVPTDTSDLTNGAGYITAASLPTDYYTKSEINALIPQPTKVPVVYYQPTNSYCYTESNNRFYGSHVYEKLYLVKPKTSGTTQIIDMSDTFSLLFTIDYTSAPSSAITVAEIMVSYAAGKGVLLQLNSTGLYYRNNITGTTITGTRALTAVNSYDVKVEYDGTHMIISYKLSSDVNYTQANSTTCTCSGSNYNYAAVGMNVNNGDIALSSVNLTNGGNTLYSYTAGQIALDYDSSLTLNGSNQLKVVVDQTYNSASTNPQSGVAIAGAGFLTGITSGDVITALGYTPYSDANPNGYTSNVGTVTSVNNTSPDGNGNVTLTIPAAQVNSDWNANSGVAEILNKPTLATVATSGSYTDLLNKPTIPTDKIFIAEYGVTTYSDILDAVTAGKIIFCKYLDTFTYLATYVTTAIIDFHVFSITYSARNILLYCQYDDTWRADTTDYVIPSTLNDYATKTWVGNQGYITGITSGDVTTALGYTPANDTDVVHLSSTETITGEKAFTNDFYCAGITSSTSTSNKRFFFTSPDKSTVYSWLGSSTNSNFVFGDATNSMFTLTRTYCSPAASNAGSMDLGRSSAKFKDLYLSGNINGGTSNIINFDGAWTASTATLSTSKAIGTYNLNSAISSYLPNDSNTYEVYYYLYLSSKNGSSTMIDLNGYRIIEADAYNTNAQMESSTQGTIIIDGSRTLSMTISNQAANEVKFDVYRYRRLGTNT